jgi:23S rRNA pseudouridine1911/1915/1917 synthase
VLSQPDYSGDECIIESVKKFLISHYKKPGNAYVGNVHRLDRPASGIMVFAVTSKAATRLSQQFRDHSVSKEYLAVRFFFFFGPALQFFSCLCRVLFV